MRSARVVARTERARRLWHSPTFLTTTNTWRRVKGGGLRWSHNERLAIGLAPGGCHISCFTLYTTGLDISVPFLRKSRVVL